MLRHAYLIMVYEYNLVIEYLVQLLDHENNGIYIHIDKKTSDMEKKKIMCLKNRIKHSHICIFSRYKVFWGTNSIAKVQLSMLEKSVREGYDYYHFLSGADLPIKSNETIQQFFEENNGKEFIHFGTLQYQQDIQQRFNVYHFFTRQLGRKRINNFGSILRPIRLQYKGGFASTGQKSLIIRFMAVQTGAVLQKHLPVM